MSTPLDIASRGETQTWQVYNLTGDTHPMHWHLVNVQVVRREAWEFDSTGLPVHPLRPIPGTARPPDPNEAGWKETLRMNPGEVTTVIMPHPRRVPSVVAGIHPRILADAVRDALFQNEHAGRRHHDENLRCAGGNGCERLRR